ncbi:MAG TPA: hypothetical protein VGN30_06060, partial [Steroidobacteraceae bacterium]
MSDEQSMSDGTAMGGDQDVCNQPATEARHASLSAKGGLLTRGRVVAGTRGLLLLTAITLTVSRAVPLQSTAAVTAHSSATIRVPDGETGGSAAAEAHVRAAARAKTITVLRGQQTDPARIAAARTVATRHADASMSEDLFATHTWRIAVAPPPPPPPPPPPVPTAPPFPYTFVGAYTPQGDKTVFFLSRADRVIDAHVGDQIDGVYDFESADAGQLVFNYLPLNIRQS